MVFITEQKSGAQTIKMEAEKGRFLEEMRADYGYGMSQEKLMAQRRKEYPALNGTHYLDYTASPPAPISTLRNFTNAVTHTMYANPHSRSASSSATDAEIDLVRAQVLNVLFGLTSPSARESWDVVFTAGATSALRIVADSYPWKDGKRIYRYLKYAHTSLVGVRGSALAAGAEAEAVGMDWVDTWPAESESKGVATLFGYPAQSNATGERIGLNLCKAVKRKSPGTMVLLDAAAYVSTSVLDLSSLPIQEAPDFIVCSLYKCFGYPTGVGCLIVKRSAGAILQRPAFFGGGTIDAISTTAPFWSHGRRDIVKSGYGTIHQRFEDGTLPFLQIVALRHAFATHKRLYKSHNHVSRHAATLTQFAIRELTNLRHSNGARVIRLYRVKQAGGMFEAPGSTLGFSVLKDDGSFVGHVEFDKLATKRGFHVRTGGLCNAGTLFESMGLTDEDIERGFDRGRSCGDNEEFDPDTKKPFGMIRISFGAASIIDDFVAFLDFLNEHYVVSAYRPTELSYGASKPKQAWHKRLGSMWRCGGGEMPDLRASYLSSPKSEKSSLGWSVVGKDM